MSKPKAVKPPPPPPPTAMPEVAEETEDAAIKKARRRSGYQRQIITGSLAPTSSGKKTVLG